MNISPFKLEGFWKKYEFTVPYLLCCSDTEPPGHPLLRKEIAALYSSLSLEAIFTFAEDLVRTQGVLIMSGSVFDFPGNFFRIGFGKQNMSDILKRFESHLQQQG